MTPNMNSSITTTFMAYACQSFSLTGFVPAHPQVQCGQ
jgi:hypothetical protein